MSQVKMRKAPHARTTFEGSDVILRGRRKGFFAVPKVSEKSQGFVAVAITTTTTLHSAPVHNTTQRYTTQYYRYNCNCNYTTPRHTTLPYTNYPTTTTTASIHYNYYTTLHYTTPTTTTTAATCTLHYTTLHQLKLQPQLHYIALHYAF